MWGVTVNRDQRKATHHMDKVKRKRTSRRWLWLIVGALAFVCAGSGVLLVSVSQGMSGFFGPATTSVSEGPAARADIERLLMTALPDDATNLYLSYTDAFLDPFATIRFTLPTAAAEQWLAQARLCADLTLQSDAGDTVQRGRCFLNSVQLTVAVDRSDPAVQHFEIQYLTT